MRRGWICDLVHKKTGETIKSSFFEDGPIEGPDKVKGFIWVAAEVVDPNKVCELALGCKNVDRDSDGWYATIYVSERGEHVCGRGESIWAAVKDAHRLAANAVELERYWNAAYAEGKDGRDHDTEDGIAQQTLSAIHADVEAEREAVMRLLNHIEDVVDADSWGRIDPKLWNAVTMRSNCSGEPGRDS